MSWKNATFINPAPEVTRTIAGDTVEFWPISAATLFELRHIGGKLAKGLTMLFSNYGPTNASTLNTHWDPTNASQPLLQEAYNGAVEPEMVAQLNKQREAAIEELLGSLTDENTLVVIGRLISDSARNLFDKRPTRSDLMEFMNAAPLEVVVELLLGVAEANGKLFRPLADRLAPLMEAAKESVEARVKAASRMEVVPEPEPEPEVKETEPSPGSPSSTAPIGPS